MGMRLLSSLLDILYFKGAECDSDNYLVVVKVNEKLSQQESQKFDVERFNPTKLSEVEVRVKFCSEFHAKHINALWAEHRISEC
jgi:hypothetical protein